ncbi:nitrous oxide reductase accessory protein NosL [Halobacterium jilantaiense]|nr:nitrous oxide reductase accessory protein NosL [Halobacterium jilantaiense]
MSRERHNEHDRTHTMTDHNHHDECGHSHREASDSRGVSRRRILGATATAVAATGGLAGCLSGGDGSGEAPEPVTLDESDSCDVCGMVVPNHPGPTSEIFYADEEPAGHANPARFDSTWEAFQFDFARQDDGWSREAFYVTDYSAVDYEVFEDGGDTLVSTHPEADAFAEAESVTFVVGSEVVGAMGRDLLGFGGESDAEAFQSEYGGDLAEFGDIDESTVASLGM